MAISVNVQPFQLFDLAAAFKTKEAQEQLEMFKAGATLHVWRRSSPHNWWLEQDGNEFVVEPPTALVRLGKPLGASTSLIGHHTSHRDGGLPESESWIFDEQRALRQEQLWNEFVVRSSYSKEKPVPFAPDLEALSPLALALFRALKRAQGLGWIPHPELAPQFAELEQQGLLAYHPIGRLMLNAQAAKVKETKGDVLTLNVVAA